MSVARSGVAQPEAAPEAQKRPANHRGRRFFVGRMTAPGTRWSARPRLPQGAALWICGMATTTIVFIAEHSCAGQDHGDSLAAEAQAGSQLSAATKAVMSLRPELGARV
jgi:hypothetical protein